MHRSRFIRPPRPER